RPEERRRRLRPARSDGGTGNLADVRVSRPKARTIAERLARDGRGDERHERERLGTVPRIRKRSTLPEAHARFPLYPGDAVPARRAGEGRPAGLRPGLRTAARLYAADHPPREIFRKRKADNSRGP